MKKQKYSLMKTIKYPVVFYNNGIINIQMHHKSIYSNIDENDIKIFIKYKHDDAHGIMFELLYK